MSVKDYELLTVLGQNPNSKYFKVKHKSTGEFFVWHTIDCENWTKQQITYLEEAFTLRKCLQHPNLLEFHDLIKDEKSSLYYLVVKYCKYGSLKYLMNILLKDNKRFSEEFVCKMFYQMALLIKTINLNTSFDIKNVYFDPDYNVKFFNFKLNANEGKYKHLKVCSLGTMMFEVCTLTKFSKKYEKDIKNYSNIYSKEFLSILLSFIKDSRDLKKNIDKIMCNSFLLVKIPQFNSHKCFVKLDDLTSCLQSNDKVEDVYALQIERIKEKEIYLQKRESFLEEWEQNLVIKEQKLNTLENKLKQQLQLVDEAKRSFNRVSKCNYLPDTIKENLDSTYVSSLDSVIVPTSKKLNVNQIIKPPAFTRNLSERRIRFKGHSPLKDINISHRRSMIQRSRKDSSKSSNEWITCSDDTDKSTIKTKKPHSRRSNLFNSCEKDDHITVNNNAPPPAQWTEENKKHAFELLRLMNKENKQPEIKHTQL